MIFGIKLLFAGVLLTAVHASPILAAPSSPAPTVELLTHIKATEKVTALHCLDCVHGENDVSHSDPGQAVMIGLNGRARR